MSLQNFPFESPQDWKHSVEDTSEPVPGFIKYFLESRHGYQLPVPGEVFALTELASALGLGSQTTLALGETQYRGPVPPELATAWAVWESAVAGCLIGENQAHAVWDASIFARDLAAMDPELRAVGVDLTRLTPLRVLEFQRVDPVQMPVMENLHNLSQLPSQHIYVSAGLEKLYGREFMLSFSHPFPQIRWLFLRLASCLPDQAPWLREFKIHPADNSLFLGEPRGWLRALLPVPPFGPYRKLSESLKLQGQTESGTAGQTDQTLRAANTDAGSTELPAISQLLLLSVADASFAARAGLEAYFHELANRGHSWHNNLWRPVWFS